MTKETLPHISGGEPYGNLNDPAEQLVTEDHLVNVNCSPSSHLPEKTQPHFASSVWCQKDHTLGSHPFRAVERKPRHTYSMPTLSAVGQKAMRNAKDYESLLSSIQEAKIGQRTSLI